MIVGRRSFILGAFVAVTPALAKLQSPLLTAQSQASPLPGPPPSQLPEDGANMKAPFKVCGWDRCDDTAIDRATRASANTMPHDPAGEQLWISVNQSWRTAWR
jgi:hypothetical protein